MGEDLLQYLGPLAALAGVWEGDKVRMWRLTTTEGRNTIPIVND